MAIIYQPSKILRRIAPKRKVERLVTQKLTLNRAAVATLSEVGVLSKKKLSTVALKVIRTYKQVYRNERADGASKTAALNEAIGGKDLLLQRVRNAALHEVTNEVKEKYQGEFYRWLPSDAEEPDPLHQLNYGQVFQLGVGEQPGDRYGCKCGMEILVDETELEI